MAETLTVAVNDGGTYTVDVRGVGLFTDAGLTTPATFPAQISAETTWYALAPTAPGRRANIEVVVTAAGGTHVPVATFNSLPATVSASEGSINLAGPSSAASGPSQGTSIGVATVVNADTVSIAYTSPWGIDGDGNPYYTDGGNAVDGEAAILCVNPATGNFAVVRPDGAVAV